MAYNRGFGGGYPANPGNMYNQPQMHPPQHQQPHPQYGQPYNRNNPNMWNMHPGPPPPQGQSMSPWGNNNMPSSFRGYNPIHDNRSPNMKPQPNMRLVILHFQ